MKQYVESLDMPGACFVYICLNFPALSKEKQKAGIFDEPKIRQLMKDKEFIKTMNQDEKKGRMVFSQVVSKLWVIPNHLITKNLLSTCFAHLKN